MSISLQFYGHIHDVRYQIQYDKPEDNFHNEVFGEAIK